MEDGNPLPLNRGEWEVKCMMSKAYVAPPHHLEDEAQRVLHVEDKKTTIGGAWVTLLENGAAALEVVYQW